MVRSRILIIYGTSEGQTAKIADAMASTLRKGGASVDVFNAVESWLPAPAEYSVVFVAASIHSGGYQRAVGRWVRAHAKALNGKRTAFVSVCLAVLTKAPKVQQELDAIVRQFLDANGWQPAETKFVAGALAYSKYGWLKRWIMRRIAAKAHGDTDASRDYEYTDWEDLKAFAWRFAGEAGAVDVHPAAGVAAS